MTDDTARPTGTTEPGEDHESPVEAIRSALEDVLPSSGRKELFAVLLMALTSILTAWTAFQSSKWGGEMSTHLSQAGAARVESVRASDFGNQQFVTDTMLYSDWLAATLQEDEDLAALYEDRFSPELAEAYDAWLENDDDEEISPFDTDAYVLEADIEAEELEDEAVGFTAQAAEANQTGDNYTLMTVIYAMVLLLAAVSAKVRAARTETALLVIATSVFTLTTVVVLTLPKLV